MPINTILNDTGGELKLRDQSGGTIGTIAQGKSGGPFQLAIQAVAVDDRDFSRKVGAFQDNSSYTAKIQNIPEGAAGFEVVFSSKDAPEVKFTA